MSSEKQIRPWYKHVWPWVLMAGPIFVVFASVAMFFVAKENMTDLVSDDYYKDGKHIDIQLKRDEEAVKRKIRAQVLISPDANAAKVFISGDFDATKPLKLLLLHPSRKADDQTVKLTAVSSAQTNGRAEYEAVFKPLPVTEHWYLRLEDEAGMWRVENKWQPKKGNALELTAMDEFFQKGKTQPQ